VDTPDALVLLDLGLAVWSELTRVVAPGSLTAIWISHLHPDHAGDLLALYQWAANTENAPRIPVYGPPGWPERLGAFLPASDGARQVHQLFEVHEHAADTVIHWEKTTLTAIPVKHSVPTWGARLSYEGAAVAYSADSGPCQALETLAGGADLFICEAGSTNPGSDYHCTPEEAAHAGRLAKRTLLTHLAQGLAPADAAHRADDAQVATPGQRLTI
jgi:ribonuclease BN (tRNA processing enzyme)